MAHGPRWARGTVGICVKAGLYDDVEVVVPLPLHPFKRCRRGITSRNTSPRGSPRLRRRSTAAASAGAATPPARPHRHAASGPATSKTPLPCRPERLAGRHSPAGRRRDLLPARHCFRARRRSCAMRPVAGISTPPWPSAARTGREGVGGDSKTYQQALFRPPAEVNPFRERGLGRTGPGNGAVCRGPASGPFRHSVAEAVYKRFADKYFISARF